MFIFTIILFVILGTIQAFGHLNGNKFASTVINKHFAYCLVTKVSQKPEALSLEIENPLLVINFQDSHELRVLYHKYTPYCKIVVTMVNNDASFEETFSSKLTSPLNPISRRDEDFYFFLCSKRTRCDSLAKLSKHLRYKLQIDHNSEEAININFMHPYLPSFEILSVTSYAEVPSLQKLFPDNTRNLYQHTLRVTAPTKYHGAYEMHKVDGKYRHKRGYRYLMFNAVMDKLNASYSLNPCSSFGKISEGASGILLSNGTWAGCMGDVLRDISDIALIVSPSLSRHGHVDFTSAMDYSWVTFMVRNSEPEYTWRIVFTALSSTVWSIVLATLTLTMCFMTAIDSVFKPRVRKFAALEQLFMRGLYLLSYLVGQDGHAPRSKSAKCLFVAWLAYGLVMGTAYASSLQSLIVSPGYSIIPKTFPELVASIADFGWGASRAFQYGLGEQLFKHSKIPIMRDIYKHMDASETNLECLLKASNLKFGCFDWEHEHRFTQSAKLGNRQIGIQYATDATFFLAMSDITRKHETFRSHFNNFYSRVFDTGLVKETLNMDWAEYRKTYLAHNDKKVEFKTNEEGPKPLKIDAVFGCYMLFMLGLVLSCVAFCTELCTSRKRFIPNARRCFK